jgi:hypothetical protein
MNHPEKLFVIKRLDQEIGAADLHREGPRDSIVVSCDQDYVSLRGYGAQPRQDFKAGHLFHPDIQHDDWNRM